MELKMKIEVVKSENEGYALLVDDQMILDGVDGVELSDLSLGTINLLSELEKEGNLF